MLDIVIEPDFSAWRWKDEEDLADAVEKDLLSSGADAIRAEGERVIALIKSGKPPFDRAWSAWRPPDWPVPKLPVGWDESAPPFE